MTVWLAALLTIAIPFLAVGALLRFSERLQDRRGPGGERLIEINAPVDWGLSAAGHPAGPQRLFVGIGLCKALPPRTGGAEGAERVGAVVRVTAKLFGAESAGKRLEIVLQPAARSMPSTAAEPSSTRAVATDQRLAA